MKKKILTLLSYVLVACIASVVTFALFARPRFQGNWAKLDEISYMIDEYFVGQSSSQEQRVEAAAAALVNATGDRWSYYVSASEMQAYNENLNNAYVGIGVTIVDVEEGFQVEKVTANGPAQRAGILPGDIICAVAGKRIADVGLETGKEMIRGEEGSKVVITVLREGQELTFTVMRQTIEVVVATGTLLEGNVGLVKIVNFNTGCAEKTIAVIEGLRAQGAESLIFDVRFNPGGYRHELVDLLDYLLPEGILFRSETYSGETQVDKSDARFLDMPMVVLVNGDSYSAAEFFAAALREYEAATVVGTQTCGKGYSQQAIPLSDGSALNLSTAKYFTPKGVSLAEVGGLVPDSVVEVDDVTYAAIYYETLDPMEDPQILEALEQLKNNG